jgi:hypothetical protein
MVDVTVRPRRSRYLRTVIRPVPTAVLVLMLFLLGAFAGEYRHSPGPLSIAVMAYALFAGAFVYQALYLARARVAAVDGNLAWTPASGRERRWLRDQLSVVVDRAVRYDRLPRRRIMVLGADGRVVLELSPRAWDPVELATVWSALGLSLDAAPDVISAGELRRQYPGTTSWAVAHGNLIAAVVVGGLLLLGVILSVASGVGIF